MAKAAREASDTFLFREWAATLAANAGHKNYIGQLKELYNAILERWRYVMEPNEWVHSSANSLIACVLGTKYNGVADARNHSLATIPSTKKGWGDCDDISTVVAAAVMAIGMKAFFRVVQKSRGGHVSVVAVTPDNDIVSIDPVGHPQHPFGWRLPAKPNEVRYFDMYAATAPSLGHCDCRREHTRKFGWNGKSRGQMAMQFARVPVLQRPDGTTYRLPTPTVITVPRGFSNAMGFVDGLAGVDEYGNDWAFDGPAGSWVMSGMAGWADVRRRWRKRFKAIKKVATKVVKLTRAIQAKILGSKVAQKLIGAALQVWGIPFPATGAVMQASATILKKGGLIGLLRLLKKSPKAAFQLVAKAVKDGLLASSLVPPQAKKYLSGFDDGTYALPMGNFFYEVAPVLGIVELDGVPDYQVATKVPDLKTEQHNTQVVLQVKPQEIGSRKRPAGQSDADWYTDAVYFATYPKAPANAGSNKTYKAAWIRISKLVATGLTQQNLMVPKKTAPTTKSTKSSSPSAFLINPNEALIAKEVVSSAPTSQQHAGKLRKRGRQTNEVWFTDVAFWRAYPKAPFKLNKSQKLYKPYAEAWERMRTFVRAALAAQGTPQQKPSVEPMLPDLKPTIVVPQTQTLPPAANTTIIPPVQAKTGSQCWEDVNQSICVDFVRSPNEGAFAQSVLAERPKTEITRAGNMQQGTGQSLADWLANVAYWRAYPGGPVVIPADTAPEFAQAWNRIAAIVKAGIGSTVPPKVVLPDLPDIDPGPGPGPGPNVDPGPDPGPFPEPKPATNWIPLAVGGLAIVAAMTMMKGRH